MSHSQQEQMLQFLHPEKILAFLPSLDERQISALFGLDVETYQAIKRRFAAQAREAAQELLADPVFATHVDHLPFRPDATIIGVGESTTDDLLSWLEILRHLLEERRPQDQVRVINAGITFQTTTQVLSRFPAILQQQPDWIICLLGTNDTARYGQAPNKTQVSLLETRNNLETMRTQAARQTETRWVWITPPLVMEERVGAHLPWQLMQVTWRNEDLFALGDFPQLKFDPVIDIQPIFGGPATLDLLGPDGVHPSLAGHKAIVKALVEDLSPEVGIES